MFSLVISMATHRVDFLNRSILNIMSNFVPNEVKTVCPRDPEWLDSDIKNYYGIKIKSIKDIRGMVTKLLIRLLWIA